MSIPVIMEDEVSAAGLRKRGVRPGKMQAAEVFKSGTTLGRITKKWRLSDDT
jgi:hypothetical protein